MKTRRESKFSASFSIPIRPSNGPRTPGSANFAREGANDESAQPVLRQFAGHNQRNFTLRVEPRQNVTKGGSHLSFPEISRPGSVDVKALNEKLKPVQFRCGSLLARAIQHELDHLNGILFIDRTTRKTKEEFRGEPDALQAATKAELELQKNGREKK